MEALVERREFARVHPSTRAFVALPDLGRLGTVRDISLRGAGCEFMVHFAEDAQAVADENGPIPADLFASDQSLALMNIKCRIAYDRHLPDDRRVPGTQVIKKRCGLRFEHLDADQYQRLRQFLTCHTA